MSEAPELPPEKTPPAQEGTIIETEFSFTTATKLLRHIINSTPVRTKNVSQDVIDDVYIRLRDGSRKWLIDTSRDLNTSSELQRKRKLQRIGDSVGEYSFHVSSIRSEVGKIFRSREFVLRNTNEEQ